MRPFSPANFFCQAYSCANIAAGWEEGTCITYTQAVNQFQINPCPVDSVFPYCDYTKAENNKWRNITCGPNPSAPILYPGDPCTVGDQCLSGTCTNEVCQGVPQGATCNSSEQCNVGLFCSSTNFAFTCQPLIAMYESGCGSDFDCINTCGCRFNFNGPPGMCYPYYSLALGSSVPCPKSGISNLCQTGTCYNPGTGGFLGTCTTSAVSMLPLGTPCTYNGQCTGNNTNGQTFYGTCTCGYNPTGSSYCTPFYGDHPGINYLNAIMQFFAKNGPIGQCQTTRRFSKDCFDLVARSTGLNPNIWYSQYLNFTYYPFLINNDDCVKNVYTSAFWTSTPPGPHPKPDPTPFGPQPPRPIIHYGNGLLIAVVYSIAFIL